jgi:hypothetical protein
VKYCPNPSCRHMRKHKSPAEFADRAKVCNDCNITLVTREELHTDETKLLVQAFHDAKSRADHASDGDGDDAATVDDATARATVDLTTGAALFVLGLALFVGPMFIADSNGVTKVFLIAIAPMGYGVYRLERGLSARRALGAKKRRAPAAGPYRT